MLEELRFARFDPFLHIDEAKFEAKLEDIFDQDQWESYHEQKSAFKKQKLSAAEFFKSFIQTCGRRFGYNLFPLFVKTIQNEFTALDLERAYL